MRNSVHILSHESFWRKTSCLTFIVASDLFWTMFTLLELDFFLICLCAWLWPLLHFLAFWTLTLAFCSALMAHLWGLLTWLATAADCRCPRIDRLRVHYTSIQPDTNNRPFLSYCIIDVVSQKSCCCCMLWEHQSKWLEVLPMHQ